MRPINEVFPPRLLAFDRRLPCLQLVHSAYHLIELSLHFFQLRCHKQPHDPGFMLRLMYCTRFFITNPCSGQMLTFTPRPCRFSATIGPTAATWVRASASASFDS